MKNIQKRFRQNKREEMNTIMNFNIRRARLCDVPKIMKIMEEAKEDRAHPQWFVADDESYVRTHLDMRGFVVVAETPEKEMAGFFMVKYPEPGEHLGDFLHFSNEKKEKTAIMDSAAVAREFRGNGLQGKMLEAAEMLLDTKKYPYLMCTVHPQNKYSLRNMQDHGYQVMDTVTCYGGLPRHILMKERKCSETVSER